MKVKKQKNPSLLSRFTPYMGKKKVLLPLSLVCSAISAVLGILSFVFIWLILRKAINENDFVLKDVIPYIITLGVSGVLTILLYFISLLLSHIAAFRVEAGIQQEGIKKILSKPLGFFDYTETGKIRKVINDGAGATHGFLAHQLPDVAVSAVAPLVLIVLIFVIDWKMGLVSLIPPIIAILAVSLSFSKNERAQFMKEYNDSLEDMSAQAVGYIRGIPVIKAYSQTIYSFKKFHDSIQRYHDKVLGYTLGWRYNYTFATTVLNSLALFLIPAAYIIISSGGNLALTITNFVFYLLVGPTFMSYIMKSMYLQQSMQVAKEAIDRIDEMLAYKEFDDVKDAKKISNYDIEFKNVSFSYEGNTAKALDNVSFRVNRGESVALVGPSGSGKTTIARLIARFWDVDDGEILIGNVNVKNISKNELMDNIAFVFQNTKLFSTSIRKNILLGKENISEEEVSRAVELSQSKDIIEALPNGLDTIIGKEGTYLSGGEQQRICLARAILKDAPIALLDEATAFADPENEKLIQKALNEIGKGKTTLTIAHRLTSVENVDKIIVLDKGKIVEEGDHKTLLANNGLYTRMYNDYIKSISWQVKAS